uniref:Ig-like domain-containing protein n=1 Tax=Neogobius melanostomus TaxID=47308 RepID=A0A8C6SPK7_9GOBI
MMWLFSLFCLVLLTCCVSKDVKVSCVFRESCVLPCPFTPGTSPLIHWTKEPEDIPVHNYYKNQHQLHFQHESYRDRTTLSDQGIRTGDASLQLHKVNVSDEGKYECYVSTVKPDNVKQSSVNLKVYAPVLEVSLEQQEQQLLCRSEGIYPEPSVVWTPSTEHNTRVTKSEQGLFSVVSSVTLSDSEDKYICNVSTAHSWRRAVLKVKELTYELDIWSSDQDGLYTCLKQTDTESVILRLQVKPQHFTLVEVVCVVLVLFLVILILLVSFFIHHRHKVNSPTFVSHCNL